MMEYTAATSLLSLLGVAIGTFIILGYLIFIWWLDRYEREPLWLVGIVFLYGALGSTFLAMFLNIPLSFITHTALGESAGQVVDAVIWAPLVEEFTKGLIFVVLILNSNFDNETDGLIYGASVGLGFAILENLLYYVMTAPMGPDILLATVFVRTLFTSLVHCISSALLGICIGWVRHRKTPLKWVIWPLIGYALAVFNHGLWNGLAMISQAVGPATMILGMLFVAASAIVMMIITQICLRREHQLIRHHLHQEASRGVLPIQHAEIIPYWLRRRRNDWLSPNVQKEAYIRAATLLAFRLHQLEIAKGDRYNRYSQDIQRLRTEIQRLLIGNPPSFIPARAVLRAVPCNPPS